ncbi:hypothetical protein, partial [Zoogloea sp.]|uniref:hypothetical protein n=1 Tax=Zoogloea sp. TaxID=49181 RepID=UPI0035AF9E64
MAAIYGEERVNYFTNDYQYNPQAAGLSGGGYVLTWVSRGQDGAVDGIYAQRFNAAGSAVGPEFRVNTQAVGSQVNPAIVGLSDGGFVVTWTDQNGDGNSHGIFGQRFDAVGEPAGAQFLVNTYTSYDQDQSAVAAYAGGFVVAWSSRYQDGSGTGIYAQRYANDGAPQGGEFLVNAMLSGDQYEPSVATFADGGFVVAWRSDGQDGSGAGVYAQRFDASGGRVGAEFQVNSATVSNQYDPHVSVLAGGGFVVVWSDDGSRDGSGIGIYAQRFDASGAKVGGEFLVNESTYGSQYQPAVAALENGGFVVTWYNDNVGAAGGSYSDVYMREYQADGTPVAPELRVNSPSTSYAQFEPAVAHIGSDNFVVVWRSDSQDGSLSGVYQQLFGTASELVRSPAPSLGDFGGSVTFEENLVNAQPQVLDVAVSFTAPAGASFDGGAVSVFYLSGGSADDQLSVRNQGSGIGQIGVAGNLVSFGGAVIGTLSGGADGTGLRVALNAAASADAIEALIQNVAYGNSGYNPAAVRQIGVRVEDGGGASAAGGVLTVNVTPQLDGTPAAYGEEQVNTYTAGQQVSPAVGRLADGGYVIVWSSDSQDGSSWGVFAQRYSAAGEAVGPEIRVNTVGGGEQSYPQVAGLSDGGFVVTWQDSNSNEGSGWGWGVFGQRYGADGSPAGGQITLNATTSGNQYHGTLASYTGGYALVWSGEYVAGGDSYDIYLTRFDNAGNVVGTPEQRVSTAAGSGAGQAGYQEAPRIAAHGNGDLLVVWQDNNGNDGSGWGVFGRLYRADTGSFGDTFRVNSYTSGTQIGPDVAPLADGGYVVVWRDDNGRDGSGYATYAQRYDAAGVAVGGEILVNENVSGSQYQARVSGLSTGGFAVAFYNDSGAAWGDVYLREFDAGGTPVDGDRLVNRNLAHHYQSEPALADLGNGNFVVVWRSDQDQDGSGAGVFQQLFGSTAELARQASPDLSDFTGAVSFAENAVNAGLQVIDAAVSLTDSDSANFNGGRLDLYFTSGAGPQDRLGVVAEGPIGIAGATVSYGGVAIGTLSGGANGSNLRIDFTSDAATPEAVEALIQHLGYANSGSSPAASRTLGLRVSDGDGGSSEPNQLTVNVTPQLDGTPAAYGEEQVNTYSYSEQATPAIGTLADGGYVIAWQSYSQDGSGWGIYAQRFNAAGEAVGAEFHVSSPVLGGDESYPQVAGLSDGGYVIVWQDSSSTESGGWGWGVFAQRFNADGTADGTATVVNTTTPGTQHQGAVAAYTDGYAVVWAGDSYYVSGGSYLDIYLTRFDNAGNPVGTPETRVSVEALGTAGQAGDQVVPRIAARANGDLAIVWQDNNGNDGNGTGVFGRLYHAATDSFGDTFRVNAVTAGGQDRPDVAYLEGGGFVVVWQDASNRDSSGYATFAQRFDASGMALGGEIQVNQNTYGSQYQPKVSALAGGGFAVAFYNDSGAAWGDVYLREFDAAGNAVDGDRLVSGGGYRYQHEPAIATLNSGNLVVAWRADQDQDGSGSGVFQQLYGDVATMPRVGNPVLGDLAGRIAISPAEASTSRIIDNDLSVTNVGGSFDGGSLWVYLTAGFDGNDVLAVRNGGMGTDQIGVALDGVYYGGVQIGTVAGGTAGAPLVVSLNAAATPAAVQALAENIAYAYAAGTPPVSQRSVAFRLFDGAGMASAPAQVTVAIEASPPAPVLGLTDVAAAVTFGEAEARAGVRIDEALAVTQGAAGFDGGSLTASFTANGRSTDQLALVSDGDGIGRVNVVGSAVRYEGVQVGTVSGGVDGAPLVVSFNAASTAQAVEAIAEHLSYRTATAGPLPARAVGLVLQDGSGATSVQNVVVNVTPAADGAVALFDAQQVNTYAAGDQNVPAVATLADGSYVVVWQSAGQDGNGWGVYGQHFTAAGVPTGVEFRLSDYVWNAQQNVSIAALSGGGYVVGWRSEAQDGSSGGVFARVFSATDVPVGDEIRVSAATTYDQTHANVIGLADGGFVVAFADQYRDGSGYGVYAQRYDAGGTPVGGNMAINSYVPSEQYMPAMAALKDDPATGGTDEAGLVVVWNSYGQDGSGWGIFGQRYDMAGNPVGVEFQVNTAISGNQYNPAVATLSNGEFVVVWSTDADYSVRGQRYTAGGVAVGAEFVVSTPDLPSNQEQWPHVTALNNGGFVVTWDSYAGLLNNYIDVWGQQFDAAANKVDGPIRFGQVTGDAQFHAVVAPLAGGNFAAVWASYAQDANGTGGYGVFQQLYGTPGSIVRQADPQLIDLERSVTFAENDVNATPQLIDPGLRVVDADSANFAGGRLMVGVLASANGSAAYNAEGASQDAFTILHEGNGAGQVGVSGNAVGATVSFGGVAVGTIASDGQGANRLVVVFNANATAAIVERVAERLAYSNSSSSPVGRTVEVVVSDGDGGQSAAQTIAIDIAPQTDGAVALLPGDTHVNTYTAGTQIFPTAIHLSGPNAGEYLIFWQSNGQDSDGYGVYGQRFTNSGAAVGAEFQVSTTTPGNQYGGSGVRAAALADGGYVVTWESDDGWGRGVFAQRYDASGNPAGVEWRVNPTTPYEELQPSVVGLAGGGFVIAYAEDGSADGNSYGTVFQRYDASGAAVGERVLINAGPAGSGSAFTDNNQSFPQLAALASGGFVAVWHSYAQDGAGWGVYARVFDAGGAAVTDGFLVNASTLGNEARPDVATLGNGDFVVVWTTDNDPDSDLGGVFMQRYTAAGVPVGEQVMVNDGTTPSNGDTYPHVTALDTGGYVVAWESDDGWGRGYFIQQYDATGHRVDGPQRASQYATSDQVYGDVTGLTGGRFVIAWSSSNQEVDWGVYQNIYGPAGSIALQAAPQVSDVAPSVTYLENTVNAAPQLIDAAVGVFDGDSADFAGGRLVVSVISGFSSLNQDIGDYRPDQDNFSILSEGSGAGQVNVMGSEVRVGTAAIGTIVSDGQAGRDLIVQFNASATQPLVEQVLERLAYRNPSTDPVAARQVSITLSDGDGGTSTPTVVTINVTAQADGALPLASPEPVNTYTASEQLAPAAAALADGGYVVVWQSNGQDGWDYGIYGQRYDAVGTPVGNEFRVSTATPYSQSEPAVAALADGGWVVSYTDQTRDGSGSSVWVQRFAADGSMAGSEFRANSSTAGSQYQPAVSAVGSGFVVAWYSDGERNGEYYDLFLQRYDAAGTPLGTETRINTPIPGNPYVAQYEPAIAGLASGNFVATWRGEGQDGSNSGIYAQLFDGVTGAAIGTEFRLNQYTTDYQYLPSIAAVGSGFVATWISRGQDGSYDGIYARRYDGAGNALGDEFRVNEASYYEQRSPSVAATGDGGFVIAWRDFANDDVWAQKFDSAGSRVDGALQISTASTSSDESPAVVGLAGNAFAVAWQAQSDGSGNGIFQRIVGEPAAFAHSAAPQIVDLAASVTFQENALNGAPQVIDPGIGLLDPDSANFNGGRLDVSFITTYGNQNQFSIPGIQAQDQLGILNEGMGVGQIGVVGDTVYFGGTAFGTVIGHGVNGASLIVTFNANATAEAVEHLIEGLTYQNFLSNPEPSRTVSVRLSDGSGGVTAPQSITLNIAPNPDGAVMYGQEQVVSRFAATGNQGGEQGEAAIAYLADGGYAVAYTDWSGADGSGYAVFARRYDANDNPLGDPFQVNLTTASNQDEPRVVSLAGGGFAVVWTSTGNPSDPSGEGVFMRRYLADGSAAPGGEVQVNTSVWSNQYMPAVSQSADGGFIVAWYSDGERDGDYYDVFFQRFDATGTPLGSETRANLPVSGDSYSAQFEPSIALLNGADGDFVVSWTDSVADGSGYGVFAQRFNADGSADGSRIQLNTYIDSHQHQSSVAALAGGGFVAVWTSYGQDTWGYGVYGQRFDAAGSPLGSEFRVNYNVASNQHRASVAGLANGGFVVSWDDDSSVWLQQYDSGGRPIDSQVAINDISTETTPDIVATDDGGFLVAYQGWRDTAHGGNNTTEVLVQRFSNTAPDVSDVSVSG